MNIKSKLLNNVINGVSKHAPEILTGIGTVGLISTVVLAVKETPVAIKALDEKKKEMETEKLPGVEIVKTGAKIYAPTIVLGAVSTACIIGGTSVSVRRNAALATTYGVTKIALDEAKGLYNDTVDKYNTYKKAVEDTVSEKKINDINEKVAENEITKVNSKELVYLNGDKELFYDSLIGKTFESSREEIEQAVNDFNRLMLSEMYGSMSQYYSYLNIDPGEIGQYIGWTVDGMLRVYFDEARILPNGKPCIVVSYNNLPKYEYDKLM